jgi:SAM-dependent methyltransferase
MSVPAPYSGVVNLELMEAARNYNDFLFRTICAHAPAAGTIIDFGAGTGTFARRLAAIERRVICVEADSALRAGLAGEGFASYSALDELAAEGADYIYSLNVLEHIADDLAALRQLRSRLRAGGRLLLYVPAFPCLFSSMDRAVGHFRRYRRRPLIGLVSGAGFDVMEARYCDSLGFAASLVFKAVGGRDGTVNETALIAYDRLLFPLSRILDRLFSRAFGKNLMIVACRPR